MESRWRGSNPRLPGPKPGALPTALHLEMKTTKQTKRTVGWVVLQVLKLCLSCMNFSIFLGRVDLNSFQSIFPLFHQGFRRLPGFFFFCTGDSDTHQSRSSSLSPDSSSPEATLVSLSNSYSRISPESVALATMLCFVVLCSDHRQTFQIH